MSHVCGVNHHSIFFFKSLHLEENTHTNTKINNKRCHSFISLLLLLLHRSVCVVFEVCADGRRR